MSDGTGAATAAPNLSELAERIRGELNAITGADRTALEHAIEAGRLLNEAKAQVAHGQWLPWLATNFTLSEATAQRYMLLGANPARARDCDSIRAALDAIQGDKPQPRKSRPVTHSGRGAAQNPAIIDWVAHLRSQGVRQEDISRAAKAGERGWPGDERGLSEGATSAIYAVLADRDRAHDRAQDAPASRPQGLPRHNIFNGKSRTRRQDELRAQLKAEADEARAWQELARLSLAMDRALNVIQSYEPGSYGLDESSQDKLTMFLDDLLNLAAWTEQRIVETQARLGEAPIRERIAKMRNVSGRPAAEAAAFLARADRLERQLNNRLSGAA